MCIYMCVSSLVYGMKQQYNNRVMQPQVLWFSNPQDLNKSYIIEVSCYCLKV